MDHELSQLCCRTVPDFKLLVHRALTTCERVSTTLGRGCPTCRRAREAGREAPTDDAEPQRIVPLACAFAAWAHLTCRPDELRRVVADSVEAVRGRWSGVTSALPLVRTLHAAGEGELLGRVIESMTPSSGIPLGGKLATSHTVARGLVALRDGDAARAVELLERAVAAERALGYEFDASVLELDLAEALEAAGEVERAAAVRGGAEAFIASLGCIHPL
jgi:hypothetical protein